MASLKLFANNLLSSEHKMSGDAKIVKGSRGSKGKSPQSSKPNKSSEHCGKCKHIGHGEATYQVPISSFCKKAGHVDTSCFTNPNSTSLMGTLPQPQPTPANATVVGGGSSCVIDGTGKTYQQDDWIEEVINGTVFTVQLTSNTVTSQDSPYVSLLVYNSLTRATGQFKTHGCCDTVSSANFVPA